MRKGESFRVTHLFGFHSAETKARQGAMVGPSPGPMAGGTAPFLTLTTVPSVLLNPQLAWLLSSVRPQHVWISHKTKCHAVPWPLLKYPCVPPYCLPQHGPVGAEGGGEIWTGRHGNQGKQTWKLGTVRMPKTMGLCAIRPWYQLDEQELCCLWCPKPQH